MALPTAFARTAQDSSACSHVCGRPGVVSLAAILTGSFRYLGVAPTLRDPTSAEWCSQALGVLAGSSAIEIFLIALRAFRTRKSTDYVAITCLEMVDMTIGLIGGEKEAVLTSVLAVLLGYIFVRRRFPIAALLLAAFLYVALVAPFVTSYREVIRTADGGLPIYSSVGIGVSQLIKGDAPAKPVENTGARFRLIDNLVVITDRTPGDSPTDHSQNCSHPH
jgi:hypothetical protein